MKKVLLIGSTGMLGGTLGPFLRKSKGRYPNPSDRSTQNFTSFPMELVLARSEPGVRRHSDHRFQKSRFWKSKISCSLN